MVSATVMERRHHKKAFNMCGIFAIFNSTLSEVELRKLLITCSQRLRHRGPDWSGYLVENCHGIAHERLAIIDPESGAQPIVSLDKNIVVAANGEIYNYKELYSDLKMQYKPSTGSDCEVVVPLYLEVIIIFVKHIYSVYLINQT